MLYLFFTQKLVNLASGNRQVTLTETNKIGTMPVKTFLEFALWDAEVLAVEDHTFNIDNKGAYIGRQSNGSTEYNINTSDELSKQPKHTRRTKILFLAANPNDQTWVETDKEHGIIKAEMERGPHRDFYEFLPPRFAVTISELLRALNGKPNIIHFAGHGKEEGITVTTENNQSQLLPNIALTRLFRPLKHTTQIVLLNSCYSAAQAKIISNLGMHVIGYNLPVSDEAAISFAKGLYIGLSEGKTLREAYNYALIVLITTNEEYARFVEVWRDGKKLKW